MIIPRWIVKATAWATLVLFTAHSAGAGVFWRRCCCRPACPPPCCAPTACGPVVVYEPATCVQAACELPASSPDEAQPDEPAETAGATPPSAEPVAEAIPTPAEAAPTDESSSADQQESVGAEPDPVQDRYAPSAAPGPATDDARASVTPASSTVDSQEPSRYDAPVDAVPEPAYQADIDDAQTDGGRPLPAAGGAAADEDGQAASAGPARDVEAPVWSPDRPQETTSPTPAAVEPDGVTPTDPFAADDATGDDDDAAADEPIDPFANPAPAPAPRERADAQVESVFGGFDAPPAAAPTEPNAEEPESASDGKADAADEGSEAPADIMFGTEDDAAATLNIDGGLSSSEARRWRAPGVDRQFEARLVAVTAAEAVFELPSGLPTRCELGELSTADLRFVQRQIAARRWQLAHQDGPAAKPQATAMAER